MTDAIEAPARTANASYYQLTDKQKLAMSIIGSDARHILLYGGSRSGKTYLIVRSIIIRAAKAAMSRHLMARFRMNAIKSSIVADTWPKVMRECFPELRVEHRVGDGFYRFPNDSEVWYAGLDDKDRTEKVLGQEFATTYLNECSQIPFASRELVVTRLAQKVEGLRNKAFYDENPPLRTHWSHRLWIEHKHPLTGQKLERPEDFASLLMNPVDNLGNIDPGYIQTLMSLSPRMRKRFLDGIFGDAGEAALWSLELLEQQQWPEDEDPPLVKIVVAVDPSGSKDAEDTEHDEVGIVVVGLIASGKYAGHAIVLEDLTMRGGPDSWGRVVVNAYRRWGANAVVAEVNYGGPMVKAVIMAAALSSDENHLPVTYREVTASRSKVVRAEPIATLYENQRAWLMPGLEKLKDELSNFTTAGYIGERSPNRADAMVWGVTALFGKLIAESRAAIDEQRGVSRSQGPKVNTGNNRWKRFGRR